MKKELLEIKRTLTIDRYNITRITGYIVDNDRDCRLEFVKNFLNLEETEAFKYLDIFKKVLSGKPGRNMFQLDFKEKTRKQHLATIVKTGLEDNDVRQIFLEEIAESIGISNKGYSLILIASGIYDIPGIATDGADLDESEEVYEYMIGCICPVSLSAAGLSYKPELADIQERTRDWVVSMPTQGFLYPAFTDRHEDPEHIWYYSKVPDKPDAGLITQTLRCGMPSTPKEQKEAFREGLNAADGKVSLEQAKDIYHYLGRIREIKAESNNRILKGAELENVLKSIGIDPELAAEKTKDCDAAEIDADNTVSTKTCSVHVVLNGEWTATLEHPIDDEGRWKYINDNAVVKMPSFNGEQLFRIKNKEKSDSGVSAELTPIFLDAKEDCFLLDVRPTEKNGQDALDIMTAPNKMYSAKSDIKKLSTAYYQTKNLIEAINGNDENSFINRWGGEILYNNYQITIDDHVGGDYGVQVLYGKNIVKDGFSETIDMTEVATRIIPKSYNGYMIAGDAPWIDSPLIEKYPTVHYKVMSFEDVKMRADASEDDETNGTIICDTQEQLEGALKKKCEEQYAAGVDKPKITIKADMELLQNTELYEDVKELEAVSLGDTVHCKHSKLRIVSDARVIELEWDAVRNKLISVTLGKFQYNFLNNVSSIMNRVEQAIRSDGSLIGQQVQGTINGVKAQLRAQSSIAKKQTVRAVLFEDLDPDSPTFGAMCLGTLGFEIASERTADGRDWKWSTFGTGQGFFADFIVAGTMLADRIKGGTLELGGAGNGNGVAKVLNADGNEIVRLDKDGVYAKGKYVCANTDGSQTATLSNGKLTFKTESYEVVIRAGAIGGLTGLMIYPEQGAVRTKFLSIGDKLSARFDNISLLASGKTTIGGASLEVQRDGKGYSGKTGKAVFSDGTYLEYVNGFLVGGNTKEGGF